MKSLTVSLLLIVSALAQAADIKYSTVLRNAQVNSIESRVGPNPVLRLCGGAAPASVDTPDGGTSFVKFTLPVDWATTATAGTVGMNGVWQGTALFTGQPTHFRIYASDGITPHIQGTVTGSGGGGIIKLDAVSPTVTQGQLIRISAFSITAGNQFGFVAPGTDRLQFSRDIQNTSLDLVQSIIGPTPILRFLTGVIPATVAASDPGTVVLTMILPSVWLTGAAQGTVALNGVWQDTSADATGVPTHGRFFESTGTTPHVQVDVTDTSGNGFLKISNPNVVLGDNVTVTGFSLSAGSQ